MHLLQRFERNLIIVHFAATFFMVGLIWTIHTVHYPLFANVGNDAYIAFQAEHVDRIGKLLLFPWLTEGATLLGILGLAFLGGRHSLRAPVLLNGFAMAVVLLISGLWSAPSHGKLADGFDASVHTTLMNANLVRTIAWTVCGISAAWIMTIVWRPQTSGHPDRTTS